MVVCNFPFLLQLKEEVELRKQMNIAELDDLDETTRLEIEGFRTGTYLRLEVHNVPYEMVEFFDPCHPILVGGIGFGEENVGYMQVRSYWIIISITAPVPLPLLLSLLLLTLLLLLLLLVLSHCYQYETFVCSLKADDLGHLFLLICIFFSFLGKTKTT